MLHKNTVQYRIRKAKESLGRPVGENRYEVELALQAGRWLGSSVLQPAAGGLPAGPALTGHAGRSVAACSAIVRRRRYGRGAAS